MSVNWDWKHKMGLVYLKQKNFHNGKINTYKISIYSANCLAALIQEFKDKETKKDMYQFYSFFNDLKHLKRCLGLEKEKDNILVEDWQWWDKVKLNVYYPEMLKVAECLAKANIKVELYYKEPKGV